jgi:hypothetical protein
MPRSSAAKIDQLVTRVEALEGEVRELRETLTPQEKLRRVGAHSAEDQTHPATRLEQGRRQRSSRGPGWPRLRLGFPMPCLPLAVVVSSEACRCCTVAFKAVALSSRMPSISRKAPRFDLSSSSKMMMATNSMPRIGRVSRPRFAQAARRLPTARGSPRNRSSASSGQRTADSRIFPS